MGKYTSQKEMTARLEGDGMYEGSGNPASEVLIVHFNLVNICA
jgi:hypothetical protein